MADQGVYMERNWLNNDSYPSASTDSWTELIISYSFWVQQAYWSRERASKVRKLFGISGVHLLAYGSDLPDNCLLAMLRMNSGCSKVDFELAFKLFLRGHELSSTGTHTSLKKKTSDACKTYFECLEDSVCNN